MNKLSPVSSGTSFGILTKIRDGGSRVRLMSKVRDVSFSRTSVAQSYSFLTDNRDSFSEGKAVTLIMSLHLMLRLITSGAMLLRRLHIFKLRVILGSQDAREWRIYKELEKRRNYCQSFCICKREFLIYSVYQWLALRSNLRYGEAFARFLLNRLSRWCLYGRLSTYL